MDRSCCFCFIVFVMDIVLTFAEMAFVKCHSFFFMFDDLFLALFDLVGNVGVKLVMHLYQ